MKKIEYKAPEMEVIKLSSKAALLEGSITSGTAGGGGDKGDDRNDI